MMEPLAKKSKEEKENIEPTLHEKRSGKKRLSLSLSRKKNERPRPLAASATTDTRFQYVEEQTISKMSKPFVPPNTSKNTEWALKNFDSWLQQCNRKLGGDLCPVGIMHHRNPLCD